METPDPRDGPRPAAVGLVRDLNRLKTDGTATAAELREFLGQMRGKRPEEVLGLVAGSGLAKSMLAATLGCLVLLAAMTVIPYFLYHRGPKPAAKAAVAKPAAVETVAAKPADTTPAAAQPSAVAAKPGGSAPAPAPAENVQRAIRAMGMDETKTADPKANPLEKSLDKLLDKIQ